ncbi:hypothetical protein H8B09_17495 [Paenibacillus sp. PR3]|uniref:Uncharacterized protein n=1 Tax=Paenibacillus terricola TaxID=2763503 RepID=A0ABR8MX97_9BACL|nr:hypothetical protein [Paenibacillus terricola]MBD3920562.1 hypothetical protein [Paenibacillus terricola]
MSLDGGGRWNRSADNSRPILAIGQKDRLTQLYAALQELNDVLATEPRTTT